MFFAGCANFNKLDADLRSAERELSLVSGHLKSSVCGSCSFVLLALGEAGRDVDNVQIYDGAGQFRMQISASTRALFVFHDMNGDGRHQATEPSFVYKIERAHSCPKLNDLVLDVGGLGAGNGPVEAFSETESSSWLGMFPVSMGQVESLSADRFSDQNAEFGMWQPISFMKMGYAGIYFLEQYSPDKIPVLFVHGVNGTPRHFEPLINALDRTKYQPWVVYYPSSIKLRTLGNQLYTLMGLMHKRHRFSRLHVVAHSMGGLVAREYLARCAMHNGCSYLQTFSSISSPFGGHPAAVLGVKYAPVAMPVWEHLVPDSAFLQRLFEHPLPNKLPHYLIFSYRNSGVLGSESGDGVVSLVSQLRPAVQQQAREIRGFDEDHMSILASSQVHRYIIDLLGRDIQKLGVDKLRKRSPQANDRR
jgi:hypothetical protein